MLFSLKYLANSNSFLFENPTKSLHFSSSICFISNKTKSVYLSTSFISSVILNIPDVSIHVFIFSSFNLLKNPIKNFTCSNGSPPVTVTPPPDKFIYVLYLFTFSIISSNVFSSPNVISHVSLLWQYLHFKLHPCKNKTNLIPGPSTVPKLSIECTFATLFNLFSM